MNSKLNREKGLREQIAAAKTVNEVKELLEAGFTQYRSVSLKTVRQWRTTAARRTKELEAAKQALAKYSKADALCAQELEAAKPEPKPYVSNGRAERRRERRRAGKL